MIAFRNFGFRLPQFDDHVPVLEPLHDAIDHFANMFVVLGVNALAFRFADFLKDDLFRHLGRYASKTDSRFLEFDFFL